MIIFFCFDLWIIYLSCHILFFDITLVFCLVGRKSKVWPFLLLVIEKRLGFFFLLDCYVSSSLVVENEKCNASKPYMVGSLV